MISLSVFVLLILSSRMVFVNLQAALEDKYGTARNVSVMQGIIGMEVSAYCVLMVRCGIPEPELADVKKAIVGMEISVKNSSLAQVAECTTRIMNNAYVLMGISGMEPNV